MAWIESHQSLGLHRKLLTLRSILGITKAQAVGHLHYLWWWCLDNAKDGNLSGLGNQIIAESSCWDNDPEKFVDALVKSGFLDVLNEGLAVHDWDDYAGRLIFIRETKRMRDNARSAKARKRIAGESLANRSDSDSESREVPNPTQPNL